MVVAHPISELSLIITMPIWGYLILFFESGKKPKPFFPITQLSKILTLFLIMEFLIISTLKKEETLVKQFSLHMEIKFLWH